MNYACRATLTGHKRSVKCLQFSPFRLITGAKEEVRIWDLNSSQSGRIQTSEPVLSVAFNDTKLFAACRNLKIFDFSLEKRTRKGIPFLRKIF